MGTGGGVQHQESVVEGKGESMAATVLGGGDGVANDQSSTTEDHRVTTEDNGVTTEGPSATANGRHENGVLMNAHDKGVTMDTNGDHGNPSGTTKHQTPTDSTKPSCPTTASTAEASAKGSQSRQEFDTSSTNGQWYYISDTQVRTATESEVLRSQAYLLFYERLPFLCD